MNRAKSFPIALAVLLFLPFLFSPHTYGQGETKAEKGGYLEPAVPEVCKVCHPDLFAAFQKENPHYQTLIDPSLPPEKRGCESCHGPGEKHVNAGGDKKLIFSFKDKNAKDRSDTCLKCHQKEKSFPQFNRGVHKLGAVGCNDCHQMHRKPLSEKLLKGKEPDVCFSCHQDVKSKFYLPTRHKVMEGAVKCSDCHTPHGTRNRASLRTGGRVNYNIDACFKCHPEKRGPWVFEHPSVKVEGCTICHLPHGSPNRFLLAHRDVRRVCIQCHGQRHQNVFFSSAVVCVNCHTQIHGSNFSSLFFR